MIRALGARYDGDPDLTWSTSPFLRPGEGAREPNLLSDNTRRALLDSYLDSFHKTPLVTQLGDEETVAYTLSRALRRSPGASSLAKKRAPPSRPWKGPASAGERTASEIWASSAKRRT